LALTLLPIVSNLDVALILSSHSFPCYRLIPNLFYKCIEILFPVL